LIAKYCDRFKNRLLVLGFKDFLMIQSVNIKVLDKKECQEEIKEGEKENSLLRDTSEIKKNG
jgi:hypothetical protein